MIRLTVRVRATIDVSEKDYPTTDLNKIKEFESANFRKAIGQALEWTGKEPIVSLEVDRL